MLTDFSVQGMNFLPPVWSAVGRFYPLADQEFNLLKFVTRSPAGYHALVALQLLVLLAVLFVVLRAFQVRYRVLILIAAMVAPSFLIPFTGFVYPERNVLFWLAVMLLCLQEYSRTKARIYFIGCLVATHCALYYKETVVLFVVAYAITQLLLQLSGCAPQRPDLLVGICERECPLSWDARRVSHLSDFLPGSYASAQKLLLH